MLTGVGRGCLKHSRCVNTSQQAEKRDIGTDRTNFLVVGRTFFKQDFVS